MNLEFSISIPKNQLEDKINKLIELKFEPISEDKITLENNYIMIFKYNGKENKEKAFDILKENEFVAGYHENHKINGYK